MTMDVPIPETLTVVMVPGWRWIPWVGGLASVRLFAFFPSASFFPRGTAAAQERNPCLNHLVAAF